MKIPSLKAEKLAQLIGIASDVALVLDKKGVIQDVSVLATNWRHSVVTIGLAASGLTRLPAKAATK